MCSDTMQGNWELWHLPRAEQFFAYANGYLRAALRNELVDESEELPFDWPDAAASLMLLAHGVELFLKGAIVYRSGDVHSTHDLKQLKDRYDELFDEDQLQWELPFHTEYIDIPEEQLLELQKKEPDPSVLYRYPEDSRGEPWLGVFGYERGEHIPWDVYEEIRELQKRITST